jgi:hypothetical protein
MAKCEYTWGLDSATVAHIHDRFVHLRRGRLVGHIRYHHRHPGPSESVNPKSSLATLPFLIHCDS